LPGRTTRKFFSQRCGDNEYPKIQRNAGHERRGRAGSGYKPFYRYDLRRTRKYCGSHDSCLQSAHLGLFRQQTECEPIHQDTKRERQDVMDAGSELLGGIEFIQHDLSLSQLVFRTIVRYVERKSFRRQIELRSFRRTLWGSMKPAELIAKAITRERNRLGVSLSALAAQAGVAKSTLSQLEAGKGNPNIETLWSLASALEVPFSYLFETAETENTLIRVDEGVAVESNASTMSAVLLANCPPGSRRDLYRIHLQSGFVRRSDPHPAGTKEHAFVCRGRVRIGPQESQQEIGIGDYFRYQADTPHSYEALSKTAVILLVMESSH